MDDFSAGRGARQGKSDASREVGVSRVSFYIWTLPFLVATSLAVSRKLTRNREFGVLGAAVAAGMCFGIRLEHRAP